MICVMPDSSSSLSVLGVDAGGTDGVGRGCQGWLEWPRPSHRIASKYCKDVGSSIACVTFGSGCIASDQRVKAGERRIEAWPMRNPTSPRGGRVSKYPAVRSMAPVIPGDSALLLLSPSELHAAPMRTIRKRQEQRRAPSVTCVRVVRGRRTRRWWIEAWAITEELLAMLRSEVASRNARFMLATLSTDIQVHPDRSIREAFQRQVGTESLFHADQRLREVAARHGIEIITLAPTMQRIAEETGGFLHGFGNNAFGHWNENGHRVAGSLLAKHLCADVLPGPAP